MKKAVLEKSWISTAALGLLRAVFVLYRWIIGPCLQCLFPGYGCRFLPSCSHYAETCIVKHGPWKGGGLMLRRLLRCHPFQKGGIDVPP